jgi:glycosyltransferase involved in cell wall biosynthesis
MSVTVVHVLGVLDRGGVESRLFELCVALPRTEVHPRILLLGDRDGTLAPRFRAVGATVDRCPLRPWPTFLFRLWHWLRAVRPDAVNSHVSLVSGLVLAVSAAAGVRMRIACLHSDHDGRRDSMSRRVFRALLRVLLRRSATSVVAVTSAALAFAAPPPGDHRYRVLASGVDTRRFSMSAHRAEANRLVHIGRAAPEKNRAFLLRVHTEAKRIRPDAHLVLAGPGGIDDLRGGLCGPAGADPSLSVLGDTDRVDEVLAGAGVLLLPSRREGLPGVVLEALAAGVPVLATRLPGLSELAGQLTGITLLPLAVGPRAWADTALRLAATSAVERAEISAAIRRSSFTLERYAETWRRMWTNR